MWYYQYGKRLITILQKSLQFIYIYHEISSYEEYKSICDNNNLCAVIYNYYPLTMSWLNEGNIQHKVPNIGVYHETPNMVNFDYIINIDPTSVLDQCRVAIPRPLLDHDELPQNDIGIPIIGSFGFESKGFERLIYMVNDQFDNAIIRLHMPFAEFGDNDGSRSLSIANTVRNIPRKDGIKIEISHNFLDDIDLLKFLNGNSINCFLYDDLHGRGCSSVIDYALSVDVPIGISNSHMFRHIYSDEICLYKKSIKEIIANGTQPLIHIKNKWSHLSLIKKIEDHFVKNILKDCPSIYKMINNTVLTDTYRTALQPSIEELRQLVPDMMARKIERANVQQAFAFKYIKDNFTTDKTMLCAVSHEDTCCAALMKLKYNIIDIDPVHNYDLHTYYELNQDKTFDVVFSVSVIEHVDNDDQFLDDMCKMLKTGGTCVFTCDFKDSYRPGDIIPDVDKRLYTKHDLLVRFKSILDNNNCYIFGDVNYDAPPDFIYGNTLYSFASMVIRKN
jgi:hypothetical protein